VAEVNGAFTAANAPCRESWSTKPAPVSATTSNDPAVRFVGPGPLHLRRGKQLKVYGLYDNECLTAAACNWASIVAAVEAATMASDFLASAPSLLAAHLSPIGHTRDSRVVLGFHAH